MIGYFLFNHFFALSKVDKVETEIESLKNLGRRISVLTNVKVLLSEYIMNETYQLNSSLPTIKTINNKIIDESYNIERTLLSINIGDEAGTLDKYNSGNLCNFISEYQNNGIFATQFDKN